MMLIKINNQDFWGTRINDFHILYPKTEINIAPTVIYPTTQQIMKSMTSLTSLDVDLTNHSDSLTSQIPRFGCVVLASDNEDMQSLCMLFGDSAVYTAWVANETNVEDLTSSLTFPSWFNSASAAGDPLTLLANKLLSKLKLSRYSRIDHRTQELISKGFEYPTASGAFFSLSLNAQSTWHGLFNSKGFLTFPITLTTKDDSTTTQLLDVAAVDTFYGTMASTAQDVLNSGSVQKDVVRSLTDFMDLITYKDPR